MCSARPAPSEAAGLRYGGGTAPRHLPGALPAALWGSSSSSSSSSRPRPQGACRSAASAVRAQNHSNHSHAASARCWLEALNSRHTRCCVLRREGWPGAPSAQCNTGSQNRRASPAGLEPATYGLEVRRAIRLRHGNGTIIKFGATIVFRSTLIPYKHLTQIEATHALFQFPTSGCCSWTRPAAAAHAPAAAAAGGAWHPTAAAVAAGAATW